MILTYLHILLASLAFAYAVPCVSDRDSLLTRELELLIHSKSRLPLSSRQYTGAVSLGRGVSRFTIPYAKPPVGPLRFANPQAISGLNGYNISNTPPACYQSSGDLREGNEPSEDCLYATYYMPTGAKTGDNLPVFVWIHGGSGIAGSSTGPGLDGSPFVASQKVIVVLLQYRLGLFGWLQTSSILDEVNGGHAGERTVAGNQAMRDVVMALRQVKLVAPVIGGDSSKIVLMGQSSGASMVRALLSTTAASGLFSRAVLVSDPANYGMSSIANNNALGEYAMNQLNCSLNNVACARAKSVDDVLEASLLSYSNVPQRQPSISSGTPWRAMNGAYVTGSIERDAVTSIPIIMTTVANEAGTITSSLYEASQVDAVDLVYTDTDGGQSTSLGGGVSMLFNAGRGQILANDTLIYPFKSAAADGLRETYETIATDGLWRCSTQYNAQHLANNGGKVWLAQWNVGSTYPSNSDADYCTEDGHVCHEDDIYTIFATAPSPTAALKRLSSEWQARLVSFAKTGQPNAANTVVWPSVHSSTKLNLLSMGSAGNAINSSSSIAAEQRQQACQQTWGSSVKYDWQLYET